MRCPSSTSRLSHFRSRPPLRYWSVTDIQSSKSKPIHKGSYDATADETLLSVGGNLAAYVESAFLVNVSIGRDAQRSRAALITRTYHVRLVALQPLSGGSCQCENAPVAGRFHWRFKVPAFRPLKERFEEKFRVTPGCWIWMASKYHFGYGQFYLSRSRGQVAAHRVAYELYVGPISEGLFVLHKCERPECVNPDHLLRPNTPAAPAPTDPTL